MDRVIIYSLDILDDFVITCRGVWTCGVML